MPLELRTEDEPFIDAWADAELAYEQFLAEYELIDVRLMSDAQFEAWKAEYKRLYAALCEAQLAAYGAMRRAGS